MATETLTTLPANAQRPLEILAELTPPHRIWPREDAFWLEFAPNTYAKLWVLLHDFVANNISQQILFHVISEPTEQREADKRYRMEGEIVFRFLPNNDELEISIQLDGGVPGAYAEYNTDVGDTYYFDRNEFKYSKTGTYNVGQLTTEIFDTIASYEEKLAEKLNIDLKSVDELLPPPEWLLPPKF